MFEHLADPTPPEPDAGDRALVGRRAQQLRRRRQVLRGAIAAVVVVVFAGAVFAVRRPGPTAVDVAGPTVCCGVIEGSVRDAQGAVPDVHVYLLAPPRANPPDTLDTADPTVNPWRLLAATRTGLDGSYHFDDVEPGSYRVRVVEPTKYGKVRHAPRFYARGDVLSEATPVDVAAGVTTTAPIELELSPIDVLRGHVAGSDTGFPVKDITVRLYRNGELTRETVTDDNGDYDLGGLAPGTYELAFVDLQPRAGSGGSFRTGWYRGSSQPATAAVPFVMPDGDNLQADVALARAALPPATLAPPG